MDRSEMLKKLNGIPELNGWEIKARGDGIQVTVPMKLARNVPEEAKKILADLGFTTHNDLRFELNPEMTSMREVYEQMTPEQKIKADEWWERWQSL